MNQQRLRAVVRAALIAASAAPSILVLAACNGQTDGAGSPEADASSTDAIVDVTGAADASGDASPIDAGPPSACSSSGSDGAGAPVFTAAGPWNDASLCDGRSVIPSNPYTCCGAQFLVPLTCVPPAVVLDDGGDAGTSLDCRALCGSSAANCTLVVASDAQTGVGCQNYGCLGRRPRGFVEDATGGADVASAWCRANALEAASVTAFRMLRADLRAHGAPKSLLRAASRAARDEKRHARVTKGLARRFGGAPRAPEISLASAGKRALEAIAVENAVEGCVRELFGAALAQWQAEHAEDAGVRAAIGRLAGDELRHAALALRVATWVQARLSPAARARVEASRSRAIDDLSAEVERPMRGDVARALGLPTPHEARAMIGSLRSSLQGSKRAPDVVAPQ